MKNFIVLKGKKIELSNETAERLCKELKDDPIYTPENIVFEMWDTDLWLHFDTDKALGMWENDGWGVDKKNDDDIIKTKLTPCKREDLKAGDWAYRSDNKTPDFTDKEHYCLIIDDKKYKYVSCDEDVVLGSASSYIYWWKVEVAV